MSRNLDEVSWFKIRQDEIQAIEEHLNEKYLEYKELNCFYDPSVWMKYSVDIGSIYELIRFKNDKLEISFKYFTNEWVGHTVSLYRKWWEQDICVISAKERLTERDIAFLKEKYIAIEMDVNTLLIQTIKSQFNIERYSQAVADIMKLKNKPIFERLFEASEQVVS